MDIISLIGKPIYDIRVMMNTHIRRSQINNRYMIVDVEIKFKKISIILNALKENIYDSNELYGWRIYKLVSSGLDIDSTTPKMKNIDELIKRLNKYYVNPQSEIIQ